MDIFLLLIVAIALATAIHLMGTVLAALLARIRISTVTFGIGFTIAKVELRRARISLRLRLLPLTADVTFAKREDDLQGGRTFNDLNRAQRIAITLAGCAACIVMAGLVLGPLAAVRESAAAWGEFLGVFGAFPSLAAPWAPIADAIRSHDFIALSALACAKVGSLNLLPLAPLNGGMALMFLLGWSSDSTRLEWMANLYLKVSLLVLAITVVLWLIGAVIYVASGG